MGSPVDVGRPCQEIDTMNIGEIKDKIVEVCAAARVVVQHFGHTKKFAKHVVALVIKQEKNLRDYQLIEFLEKDPLERYWVIK